MDSAPVPNLPPAPSWSLVVGPAGQALVIVGLLAFLLAAVLRKDERWSGRLFWLGSLSLFGVFGCLVSLFVKDQFQYQYVFGHGDSLTELRYKISGVWSGQQGSFLLWACCAAIFGLAARPGTGSYRAPFTAVYALFLASLCGILAYETPFNLMKEATAHGKVFLPPTGVGLSPSLENYWMVIHPPTIFLGFGSLTVPFAYAIAAMVTGDLRSWIRQVRGWSIAALAVLGLGLSMGGFWAYETLGWGGFWAWDPVENVSFVPWLLMAVFIHGLMTQTATGRSVGANLIFGGLPMLSFMYGTLLTRSGWLSEVSVHSFAEMDKSARSILMACLGIAVIGFFALYFVRGRRLIKEMAIDARPAEDEKGIHREGLYRFGNLMLSLMAVAIAVGMSWPLVMAISGRQAAVVEEKLYHQVLVYFFIPIMLFMGVAPFVGWRSLGGREVWRRLINVTSVTLGLTGFAIMGFQNPTWGVHVRPGEGIDFPFGMKASPLLWIGFLTGICLFTFVANLWRAIEFGRKSKMSVGGFVSHIGLATMMAGLIISRGFEHKERVFVREGRPGQSSDYAVSYKEATDPNMRDRGGKVLFEVKGERENFIARPGLYYKPNNEGEDQPMVWPHIERQLSHDVYFTLNPPAVFVWEKPRSIQPGQTIEQSDIKVTYVEPTRRGEAGMAGTEFGAKLKIVIDGETYEAEPSMRIGGEGGPEPQIRLVNNDFAVTLMGMNAADKTVQVQMLFSPPVYPIDLFYKPMTILVWAGAGILFLGGIIAAVYRRFRPRPKSAIEAEIPVAPPEVTPEDAPVPTP